MTPSVTIENGTIIIRLSPADAVAIRKALEAIAPYVPARSFRVLDQVIRALSSSERWAR